MSGAPVGPSLTLDEKKGMPGSTVDCKKCCAIQDRRQGVGRTRGPQLDLGREEGHARDDGGLHKVLCNTRQEAGCRAHLWAPA